MWWISLFYCLNYSSCKQIHKFNSTVVKCVKVLPCLIFKYHPLNHLIFWPFPVTVFIETTISLGNNFFPFFFFCFFFPILPKQWVMADCRHNQVRENPHRLYLLLQWPCTICLPWHRRRISFTVPTQPTLALWAPFQLCLCRDRRLKSDLMPWQLSESPRCPALLSSKVSY